MSEANNQSATNNQPKPIHSFDQISNIIKRKDASYASHYKVPSLKRDVPFNEINTSQQKRIVKSVIDSPVYNTEFIYTFRDILKENCQDNTIDIDNLTIIDKLVLALGMRSKSIGSLVDLEIETKAGTKVSVSLDVNKILSTALETIQDIGNITIDDPFFKIECGIPTIGTEYKLEKELRTKQTDIDIKDITELRKTVGEAFVSELVKYIVNVSVKNEKDELIPVEWNRFNYTDRIRVVETFKTGLLKNILTYINQIRKEIDKIELVKFEFDGEVYDRRLSIDGNFFTIS